MTTQNTESKNSHEYEKALEVSREASKVFRNAQWNYRNGKIGDLEFLEAKRIHDASCLEFDKAFLKEIGS